ncbi:MAG: archaellin/type IV pilin N-terminal domain-containing protein [Candidatus Bathyarchaeia archaeon]
MNWKKPIAKIAKQRRAMMGLEAAIILIAFVIIAGAFSFMVINQGLFATERGKTVVQDSLRQSSTPLAVDGSVLLNASSPTAINAIVIPLKAYGVRYVAMGTNQTAVTIKIGEEAWPNIYEGVAHKVGLYNETGGNWYDKEIYECSFSDLVANVSQGKAKLFIQNSNGDDALDSAEKGYLVIYLSTPASSRTHVIVEVRPEKSAPLTVEFFVPESLPLGWVTVAG